MKVLFLFLTFFQLGTLEAKINFENLSLEKALEKAKVEDKLVFVDTHAQWCGPCKIMDRVFDENKVSAHFNENYINIKIDMDGPYGQLFVQKYNVVWLPTLLILDHSSSVIVRIEKLISGAELIDLSSEALAGKRFSQHTANLNSTPFSTSASANKAKSDYDPNSKEQVIYIYDTRGSSGRPHIMYQEAYLHLQLMDGKHQEVVRKYLSTQSDWSTEKNLKLIFDFLNDVNSEEFKYFIQNKDKFENLFGHEKVARSLAILIHQRLEQGYPRPSLKEANRLYSLIDVNTATDKAYKYFLNKCAVNNEELNYINYAEEYLRNVNPYEHKVIHELVSKRMQRSDHSKYLDSNIEFMLTAYSLDDQNFEYLYTLSKLYFELKDDKLALNFVEQSIELATTQGKNVEKLQELKQRIKSL